MLFESSHTRSSDNNILLDGGLVNLGIDILVDEVVNINAETKSCQTKSGETLVYDKLIMGIGSTPIIPSWLKGTDLENVFTIPNDKDYLDHIHEKLDSLNKHPFKTFLQLATVLKKSTSQLEK